MKIKISPPVMVMMMIKLNFIQKILLNYFHNKLLNYLHNKFINLDEFNEEYNKFMDNVAKLENFKSKKKKGSVSTNQKK